VTNAPVLKFLILDGTAPFILTTDTSDVSLAATLAQVQDRMEHPIAFHSRSLNDAEKRRGSAENEVNAIVSGINVFRQYLLGNKFLVYTDNAACIQILKKPNLSPKLHRWALMIQDYDFDIFHKAGKANTVCDALSRIQVQAIHTVPPSDEIRVAQRRDAQLLPVIQYLLKGTYPQGMDVMEKEKLEKEADNFEIIDGILFRRMREKVPVVVIPEMFQETMLYRFHDSLEGMHQGIRKTHQNLLSVCWWYGMKASLEKHLDNCESCAQVKNPYRRNREPMKGQYPQLPMETVCSDICGPFPITT
jgi:hypothetical protein